MLYRKAPPTAPILLLRIVAVASASAIAGACSSSSGGASPGDIPPADSGGTNNDGEATVITGSLCMAPDGGFCGGGSVANPYASDAASETGYGSSSGGIFGGGPEDASPSAPEDGGQDASDAALACGTGVCGLVVHLDGGEDQ